jgi:hypothetical protein
MEDPLEERKNLAMAFKNRPNSDDECGGKSPDERKRL